MINSVIDQIGGKFLSLPNTQIYLSNPQEEFFTIPSGLIVSSNRKFVWSLDEPVLPGVIGITNVYSTTPTVKFDPLNFTGGDVAIICTVLGQPKKTYRYSLFVSLTSLTSSISLMSLQSSITTENIEVKEYTIYNLDISLEPNSNINSSLVNSNLGFLDFILTWSAPKYSNNLLCYKLEAWNSIDSNWQLISTQTKTFYSNANPNLTYRVAPVYSIIENVNSSKLVYLSSSILDTLLNKDKLNLVENYAAENINISSALNNLSFYSSFEDYKLEEKTIISEFPSLETIVIQQITSPFNFSSSSILDLENNLNLKENSIYLPILINSSPSRSQFWSEATGV